VIVVYVRLALATALVLAPGWLVARALGLRSAAATLAWSLALMSGAFAVTFALHSTLTLTLALLAAAGVAGGAYWWRGFPAFRDRDDLVTQGTAARSARGWPFAAAVPGRRRVFAAGVVLGLLLWRVAPSVQGDGLFHLARVRKLVDLHGLSLDRVSEFADGSLHPGYAFPLWHGFLALVARLSGEDPEVVVRHLPSILAPIAVLVAYEAGWALFRRTWAAGASAAAGVAMVCFAPGHGGSYVVLTLPATTSRQLLVPAALALALESIRAPSAGLLASTAAAGLVLAVVHPTYAIFLWIPFVGFLAVRWLWARRDLRAGGLALGALAVPAALFMAWLIPVARDTRSVSPSAHEVRRAFAQYPGQLNIRSDTSYSLAAEVFTRSGAVAIAALLLIPLAGLAARRRWAALVVGGSLAVFLVMLVPLLFTTLADVVSISQARRAAGFLPFAFAFAGGMGVLVRALGPVAPPLALLAGIGLQLVYPGSFDYLLKDTAPAWITWIAVAGALAALVLGLVRRRSALEASAPLAATLFLIPVVVAGLVHWTRPPTPAIATLTPGLVDAVRREVPKGSIVYSDQATSYLLAAYAPVYIAVAPPGHVADTKENRPYERARDARRFQRTGDLAIPKEYGARYLVVDRLRGGKSFDLPVVYRDPRFTLYRLPSAA
jgi:hypothetical protein